MAADELFRQAEFPAKRAHLVLEQFAQRLDQLHPHPLGKPPDIVVALDRHRGPAGEGDALDHVRVKGALRQESDRALAVAGDAAGLGFERVDEQFPDGLALRLGVVEPLERADEFFRRVDMDERDVEMAAEEADHLVRLALPHQAVVDEDAGQLVADRLVDQHRRHRRIDPAGKSADHPAFADLGADAKNLLLAEGGHGPVALESGDLVQKVGDQPRPVRRVDDLGVEHGGVVAALLVGRDGVGRVLGDGVDPEPFRQAGHPVAVAHPHRIAAALRPHPVEQRAGLDDLHVGPAELGGVAAFDLAAQLLAKRLLAVADGEDRNAGVEDRRGRARAAGLGDRGRAAGKDHRLGLQPRKGLGRLAERVDLAIDARLTHPPRNQLRHLGAEIDDKDAVVMHATS